MKRFALLVLMFASVGFANTRIVSPTERLNSLSREYLESFWAFHPFRAVHAGLHVYDGVLPDRSEPSIENWVKYNRRVLVELESIGKSGLDAEQRIDWSILHHAAANEIFVFEDLRDYRLKPTTYDVGWGVLALIRRDYAPLPVRMRAATIFLSQVPSYMRQAKANLDDRLPAVFVRVSLKSLRGTAEFVRNDVPDAFSSVDDHAAQIRLKAACKAAGDAIYGFADYLETEKLPNAHDDFAIGATTFRKMLKLTEGLDISLARLREIGEADLQRNLARARAITKKHFPGKSVAEMMATMSQDVFTAETLIPSIAEQAESVRQFCIDHNIITIPSEIRALITETPKFARWATAMMSTPGPFERNATEAYYDVTPVDPNWSPKEQTEWLESFNKHVSLNVTVHEAYPGHYVQFLHSNRARSDVQKAFTSYAAVEGWAHYAEQMMVEEGFQKSSPLYELGQLQDALLRNCRFLCAIGMHTDGMTVAEATTFFMENAFLGELPSRLEAERGTFDPGYFKYTLGKLQILNLREDYRKNKGSNYSLREFHDRLLSRGMPPVEVIRAYMLGPGAGPSLK